MRVKKTEFYLNAKKDGLQRIDPDSLDSILEKNEWSSIRDKANDDDCEMTAPYIDMLPDESGKEDGSPLKF